VTDASPLELLSAFLESPFATKPPAPNIGPAIAVGWATVELDRAVVELGVALGLSSGRFREAPASAILGGRCLIASGVLEGGVSLALLEPNAEGRLAATLARLDEGPVIAWFPVESLNGAAKALAVSQVRASLAEPGPFGLERLVLDGPTYGPHRLLIEQPGTIRG
jgi:hypothetical protein